MQWGSLSDFFAMGGYGLYVWTSFGAAALCMGGEVLLLWRRSAAAAGSHDGA
jgi:heme exporter protein D